MNEQKTIEESPLRLEKKVKQIDNNFVISSFQKHEALVLTDNSDHYAEWPTAHSNKLPGYKHKPIINKVVMKDKKDMDIIQKVMDSIRQCSLAKSNKLDLKAIFKQFDTSGDGLISKDEMSAALLSLNINLDKESIHSIYRYFDPSGSGQVDFGEFIWTFYNRKRLNNTSSTTNYNNSTTPKPQKLDMQKSLSKIKLKSKIVDKFLDNSKQSAKDILGPLTEQKENTSDTVEPETKSIYMEEDKLLYLAEQLLSNVTSCINPRVKAAIASSHLTPNEIDKLLDNHRPISSGTSSSMMSMLNIPSHKSMSENDSHMTQIEWLLRGLPEAYDSEPQFDDETVEAILKEGGSPPTQLVLPSVYAVNQKVLNKLNTSKVLRIKFNHLLVFSARFGLRKEGSYLVIHPPIGCIRSASEPTTLMLPLSELQDVDHQIAQLLRKNTKRDSIRNYFVGSVDLDKKIIELKLNITDEIMREWINNTSLGTIKIEIFGYLAPRDTLIRGKLSEPACIASTNIPLGGLLGTPSLDAILHCDLEVDIASHSSIVSRMSNISFGQSVAKPKPLGTKLGTLTTRITLLSEENKETKETNKQSNKNTSKDMIRKKVLPGDEETSSLLIPVMNKIDLIPKFQNDNNEDTNDYMNQTYDIKLNHDNNDKIHNALAYIPTEVYNTMQYNKYSSIDLSKFEIDRNRSIYGPNVTQLNCNFGLAICGITNLQLSIETIIDINKSKLELMSNPEIIISYKLSSLSSDQTKTSFSSLQTSNHCLLISQTKLYQTDINHWVAPILEIWIIWKQKSYIDENNHYIENKKQLLGLSRFPKEYNFKQLLTLPIIDTMKSNSSNNNSDNNNRGELIVSILLESDIKKIENFLFATINKFQIDMNKAYKLNIHDHPNGNNCVENENINQNISINIKSKDELIFDHKQTILNATNPNEKINSDIKIDNEDSEVKEIIQKTFNHHNISDDSIENLCNLLKDYNNIDANQNIQLDSTDKLSLSISNEFNESKYHEEVLNNYSEKSILYDLNNEISSEMNNTNSIELPPLKSSQQEPHIATIHNRSSESIDNRNSIDVVDNNNDDGLDNNRIDNNDIINEDIQSISSDKLVHLLDFSIQGAFNYISLKSEAFTTPHQIFGCYVCYHLNDSLSSTTSSNLNTTTSILDVSINNRTIWWDGDCSILNGSIRHRFEGNLSSVDSLYELLEIDIIKKGLTFQLLSCDVDGNLSNDSILLGEAFLSITTLYDVLTQLGCNKVLSIPIQFMNIDPTIFSMHWLNSDKSIPMLHLIISHRIEPVLLRKSMESIQRKSNEIKQQIINNDTCSVNTSLGFELTLQDLDNIHKLRNTFQNPIWIPFDNDNDTKPLNVPNNENKQDALRSIESRSSNDIPQSKDGKCSIDLEVILEEYAHLNLDLSKLTKPSIVCTASAKIHPLYETTHSIMDTSCFYIPSDAYLINPASKTSDNLIIPWKEPCMISLKGILPPQVYDNHLIEDQQQKVVEDMDLLHIDSNSNNIDTSKILKGASIVVSIYLRQQLFTNTIYISNDMMNSKRTTNDEDDDRNIKLTDQFLGSAVIDISTLALGMPIIQGWYHLIDELHNCMGQIKLSIKRTSHNHKINQDQSYSFIQPELYLHEEDMNNKLITSSSEDLLEPCESSLLDLRGLAHDALKKSLEELQAINDRLLGNMFSKSIETSPFSSTSIEEVQSIFSNKRLEQSEINNIIYESKDNCNHPHTSVIELDQNNLQASNSRSIDNKQTIVMLPNNNRSAKFWNEDQSCDRFNESLIIELPLKQQQQQQIDFEHTNEMISYYQHEIQSYKEANKPLDNTYDDNDDIDESIEDHSHVISSDYSSSYQCKAYETDEYMPDFESISTATNEFYASRSGMIITNDLSHIKNEIDDIIKDRYSIDTKEMYQEIGANDYIASGDEANSIENDEKYYDNDEVEYIDEFEEHYSESSSLVSEEEEEENSTSSVVHIKSSSVVHIKSTLDDHSEYKSISIDNMENNSISIDNIESDKSTSKSVSIDNYIKSIYLDDNTSNKSISILDSENNKSISILDSENNKSISIHTTKSLSQDEVYVIDDANTMDSLHANDSIFPSHEIYHNTNDNTNNNNNIDMIFQDDILIIPSDVNVNDLSSTDNIVILESSMETSGVDIHQNTTSIIPTTVNNIANGYNIDDSNIDSLQYNVNNEIYVTKVEQVLDKQDDSPNTMKIKGVIDQEIERIFGINVSKSNEAANESIFKLYKQSKDIDDRYKYLTKQYNDDINDKHQWHKSEETIYSKDILYNQSTTSSTSKDTVLYKNIIEIQNLLPSDIINNKALKNSFKYPIGKQRKFINDETNRISNIMMNVLHKKHGL